jgi:hypothetical protein
MEANTKPVVFSRVKPGETLNKSNELESTRQLDQPSALLEECKRCE